MVSSIWNYPLNKHRLSWGVALFGAWLVAPLPGLAAELVVDVVGADSDKGQIRFGLYNSPIAFPDKDGRIEGTQKTVKKGKATAIFEGLTPGYYAVVAFHDENDNDAFDQGLFGIPLESFGFSNGAVAILAAPSFESARILVPEKGARITIHLD